MPPRSDEHWTKTLYDRYPDLYLPILEARKEEGALEAAEISKILEGEGMRRGKILDLGCGIGRHSIPLARLGYEVVGCDLSSLFIARAKSWAASERLDESRVRFYEGDIRTAGDELLAKKEGPFDAVLNLFSSLGAYGEAEDAKIVAGILKVSAPGCIHLIETLNRDFLVKKFQAINIQPVSQSLRLIDIARFDIEESTMVDDWRFYTELSDGSLKLELSLQVTGRVYTLHELKNLVAEAGWTYLKSFGGIMDRSPVGTDSPSMVLVCRNGK